jgi:hypothetical protein
MDTVVVDVAAAAVVTVVKAIFQSLEVLLKMVVAVVVAVAGY